MDYLSCADVVSDESNVKRMINYQSFAVMPIILTNKLGKYILYLMKNLPNRRASWEYWFHF